jgi:hypothetical protein
MKTSIYIFFTLLILCVSSCGNIDKIEDENRNRIKNLKNEEIIKILIYVGDSKKYEGEYKKPLEVMTDKHEISVFNDAFKSFVKHHPNHPRYIKEWYLTIDLLNGEDEDLIVMQEKDDPKNLYITCLGHQWLGGGGTSKSSKLFLVFKENNLINTIQKD